jgi:4-amino-4-deoxy-L-arabinose transferase-like glycosyltransferase
VRIALALLAIAVCGAGLTVRLRGGLRWAAAVLLGIGAWSAAYAAALLFFGSTESVLVAKEIALIAAGALLLLRFGRSPESGARSPAHFSRSPEAGARSPTHASPEPEARSAVPPWLWLFFAASCALATAAVIEHTLRFPDGGYDAWMIWNTRARFLVRAADYRTAFSPRLLFWLHQDYPWLLPGAVAQAFQLAGTESPVVPAAISWLFGALAMAVLTLSAARLRGPRWGLLAGLVLATTPCFATFSSNQQSDVPLAAFLALAVALLMFWQEADGFAGARAEAAGRSSGGREDLLLLSGFAAGIGAWTKNEGLLYLVCLALALVVRERKLRPAALFLLGSLPLLALLAGFKLLLDPPNDFVLFTTPGGLLGRALSPGRWSELLLLTLRRVVYFQDFALWVVAELLLLIFVLRKLPGSVAGTALVFACAAYAPIYVLQPHPVEWIYRTSVDRLFIQIWPAAILATLLPLGKATAPAPATART